MLFTMLLIAGCPSQRAEPTPDIEATVNARLTGVANDTPKPTSTDTPKAAVADRSTPAKSSCRVTANSLNVRAGPNTIFEVLAVLPNGSEVIPQKVSPDGGWIWGEVENNQTTGWLNSAPQYIDCSIAISTLPVDVGPATPTATPIPEIPPTPTLTPTAIVQVVVPRSGGGNGDLRGDVFTSPRLIRGQNDFPTFTEQLSLQVVVYDPNANQGSADGAGIEEVEITVYDADEEGNAEDTLLYSTVEKKAAFCTFGGNGPCNSLNLVNGATWPGSGIPFESGAYSINFRVFPTNKQSERGDWRIRFRIQLPGDPAPNQRPDLVARIVEVMRDGALVFRVEAFDPAVGNHDGDGIERVELRIIDADGREIYHKTEKNAAYCAFGGDHPCPTGDIVLEEGEKMLQATVFAQDGRTISVQTTIVIDE